MKAVNASDEYKNMMNYYWLTSGELTTTHCVMVSIKFLFKIPRIAAALLLSFLVNFVFISFCMLRMRLVWPGNSRKNKQLVKSIYLETEPKSENAKDHFHFYLAGLGVFSGVIWSLYSGLDTFQGRSINPLEKMLIGLVLGFSFALTVEVILGKAFESKHVKRLFRHFHNKAGNDDTALASKIEIAMEPQCREAFTSELHFWSSYLTKNALRLFQQCEFTLVCNRDKQIEKLRLFIGNSNANSCKMLIGQLTDAALAFPVYKRSDEKSVVGYVFSRKLLVLLRQCVFEQREDIQDVPTAFMEDIRDHDESA